MKKMKKIGIKAMRGDLVENCGKNWTIADRIFDPTRSQSFYLLRAGRGRSITSKWVRSDAFTFA